MLFLRKYAVRFIIGVVLASIVYVSLAVWIPYRREQRIARKISACGGRCFFGNSSPDWIPTWIEHNSSLFHRITVVDLSLMKVPPEVYDDLSSLSELDFLMLMSTETTNDDLKSVRGLQKLTVLSLRSTQVTDAGLAHLKGLTGLQTLHLPNTETTPAGRDNLRRALPNCNITPQP